MNGNSSAFGRRVLAAALLATGMGQVQAGDDIESLKAQIRALQQQLQAIEKKLAEQDKARSETEAKVDKVAKEAGEWKEADSVVHLAGYASIGYTDNEGTKGRFSQVQYSPIFHYMYKDRMMLEAELEIMNEPDGETEVGLEYLTFDVFLNDYMALVAGKFLSPIGQFRQNLHPGWINKLPTAPSGFGHDGAAPASETGLQLRGGLPPFSGMRANYAVYVGNGPELIGMDEDGDNVPDEIEGVDAEGRTSDADGSKVWGGRFGLIPMAGLELGISYATGEAAITRVVDADENDVTPGGFSDPARSYRVTGFDLAWQRGGWNLRGEYVRTRIGGKASSFVSDGATWRAWYAQAAYRLSKYPLEGVLRYADFDSPHADQDQQQWALGVNYLFAPQAVAKVAYEFNDGQDGSAADDDSLLLQISYGF